MNNFKKLDLLFGWIIFAAAAITYLLTIEPTASLWDCGEFITSAYKLEVGHPPGAPLFAMAGRLFTMLAPSVNKVAAMANSMSAFASAFTILFLFWSITHLMRKYFGKKPNELTTAEGIVMLGAGIIGALAYTWSDTFWFSAVEAEVYATSSLFTAVVFWAALKWEEVADEKYSNRWLILIAYLTGLSIGVHLLNLLVIPAIAMIYYFRKYKATFKGVIYSIIIGGIILGCVLFVIIPWVPRVAFWFDYLFANKFGLPINSGTLFFVVVFAGFLSYLIYYTQKKGKVLLNTIILCFAVISLGFTSYAMIVIRASANTPMEQNNPDNIRSLMSYLNREQYGSWPLLSGQYYNAPMVDINVEETNVAINGKYEAINENREPVYDKRFTTIFPRMHSTTDQRHVEAYKEWGNIKGTPIVLTDQNGKEQTRMVPTFAENMRFMFSYQLGWMYWRYFMWNFAGRQNDYQGDGNCLYGNWISGIPFIDNARLGPQENLPSFLKNNKAHNKYYMLPLLLGILGIVMQWTRNKNDFSVVLMLFFITGIAIILYLNQTPYQPRERDYAYAGSFYAFAIWIGIGVAGIYELIKKILNPKISAIAATVVSMTIPLIMVNQNWDDHDRSGRYITVDFGTNYLESCGKDGVVFVYGDNDTFSLWYSQEVEDHRTDVRVANTSYLYSDWYYEQLLHRFYDSHALNLSATFEKIAGARRNYVTVNNDDKPIDAKVAMNFVMSDDSRAKRSSPYSLKPINFFPSKNLVLKVDKDKLRKNGIVSDTLSNEMMNDDISIKLNPENGINKNLLAVLDIVINNFETRPICFGVTIPNEFSDPFRGQLQTVGLAQILTPEKLTKKTLVNVEKNYDLYMNKFKFRGLNDPKIYWDETATRMTAWYRNGFMQLAEALIVQGDSVRALKVLDKYEEALPIMQKPFSTNVVSTAYMRHLAGDNKHAIEILKLGKTEVEKELKFYLKLGLKRQIDISNEIAQSLTTLRDMGALSNMCNDKELAENILTQFESYMKLFPEIANVYNIK